MTSGGNSFNDFPENQLTSINHLPSVVYWLILAAKTFDRCYTGVCVYAIVAMFSRTARRGRVEVQSVSRLLNDRTNSGQSHDCRIYTVAQN